MPLIAMDWTEDGAILWTADGVRVQTARDLGALVERLPSPSALVCWTSFYWCDRHELARLRTGLLAPGGHDIVGLSSRAAEVLAAAAGDVPAPDEARHLFGLVTRGGAALDDGTAQHRDWRAVRDAAGISHAVAQTGGLASAAPLARASLGRYLELDEGLRAALGDGHDYCDRLLDALWRAACISSSRDAFERCLVLTDAPVSGELARTVRVFLAARRNDDTATRVSSPLTAGSYRRALRWAYARLRAVSPSA